MKGALQRNNFKTPGPTKLSRQLKSALIGLGPAVGHKNPVRKAVVHQQFSKLCLGLGIIKI